MTPVCTSILMLFVLSSLVPVTPSPTGAPLAACDTLKPGHGPDGQTSESPYSIKLSSELYSPGSEISITIEAHNGTAFKGFLAQARLMDPANAKAVGTFKSYASGTKALSCFSTENSAVTHTDPSNKTTVALTWVAPTDQSGPVQFTYTVVQSVNIFWVMQKSTTVQYTAGTTNLHATAWLTVIALMTAVLRV